jgi:hypothetical protein
MSTTVRARDAAQFLSLVPQLLGFTPTRSLVLVPLSRSRSLGAMRVDLPRTDTAVDSVASTVVGMLCRIDRADSFAAVVYTDAAVDPLPHGPLVEALSRRADAGGLRLVDALVVAADGWGSHLDPDHPAGGHPLERLAGDAVARHPDGDQASGAALPPADDAECAAVAAALESLGGALQVVCGLPDGKPHDARIDPAALEAVCALDDLPTLYETALTGALPPLRTALLAWCLSRPALRDVALVQWATDVSGGDAAMEAQRRWEDGAEYPVELAEIMWGDARRPDPARLEAGLQVCRSVAARAPESCRVGALSMCAWLSWALGRSTHADCYALLAQEIEPDHGLADIVRSFVAAGHLPDWSFRGR